MEVVIDGIRYVPMPKPITEKTMLAALEVRFDSDAGDELTVRDYLRTLLTTLWAKQESFSGKRPFGNSDWEFEPMIALAKAGFVDLGPVDEEGTPYNWTNEQANKAHAYISDLILAMCHGVKEG